MIAAFGMPKEPEPCRLTIAYNAVRGVHVTRLAAGRLGSRARRKGEDHDRRGAGNANRAFVR